MGPNILRLVIYFGDLTVVGMRGTRSEKSYSYKTDFETGMRNKDFRRRNISMS